jgi:hypothetical protein
MHFDLSVVADQSQLTKFVQEKAHPGSGRSDHFRQSCLTDRSIDWRWLSIFSEIGQQKKKAPAGGRAKAKPAMVSVSRLAWVPGIACQVIKSVLHSINSQPSSRFSKLQDWRWKNGGRFGCPSAEFKSRLVQDRSYWGWNERTVIAEYALRRSLGRNNLLDVDLSWRLNAFSPLPFNPAMEA